MIKSPQTPLFLSEMLQTPGLLVMVAFFSLKKGKIDQILEIKNDRELLQKKADSYDNLIDNDVDITVKLTDIQADCNSPLYSAKRFEDLAL